MEAHKTDIIFLEKQRFRQRWLWLLLIFSPLLLGAAVVYQVILGIPFGHNPAPDVLLIVSVSYTHLTLPTN